MHHSMTQSSPRYRVGDIVLVNQEARGQVWITQIPQAPFSSYVGHLRWIDHDGWVNGEDHSLYFEEEMRLCPHDEVDVEYWALWRMKN